MSGSKPDRRRQSQHRALFRIIETACATNLGIVSVAAFTGMRRNEILALRWTDLDPQKKTLRIERSVEETKSHGLRFKGPKRESHKRTITIDDDLLALLLAERDKHLIAGVPGAVSTTFVRKAARLGFKMRFHDLRGTHETLLLDNACLSPPAVGTMRQHCCAATPSEPARPIRAQQA